MKTYLKKYVEDDEELDNYHKGIIWGYKLAMDFIAGYPLSKKEAKP